MTKLTCNHCGKDCKCVTVVNCGGSEWHFCTGCYEDFKAWAGGKSRWISCEVLMPKTEGWYLVTAFNPCANISEVEMQFFDGEYWKWHPYSIVLAWMPLPKPYENEMNPKEVRKLLKKVNRDDK